MEARTITPAPIRKTLSVTASREKAFAVFTEGFDRWWPKSHTVGAAPLKRAILEPGVGGRWYGVSDAGVEDIWGEVLVWDPPARLVLAWRIDGEWKCDPAVHTEVELRFTDLGAGATRVDFEHRDLAGLGAGAVETAAKMDSGWGMILDLYRAAAES